MFQFLCKTTFNGGKHSSMASSPAHKLHFLLKHPSKLLLSMKCISDDANRRSFAVRYLINSCGLSSDSALLASKQVNFETPEKPDAVLSFLRNHGFSKPQISILIRKNPRLLLSNPDKTLLPKLEFFTSKGVKRNHLAQIICRNPNILRRSLDKRIIPVFMFFKDFRVSNERTVATMATLLYDYKAYLWPNIEILRGNGVAESVIFRFVSGFANALMISPDRFKEILDKVKGMGFDPSKISFGLAMLAFVSMSESTWNKKMDAYKKWGLSEKDVYEAFRRCPWCMVTSEDKIMAVMDCIVNKMGFEPMCFTKRPLVINFSLEKRIVPRASVLQILFSKGLVKKNVTVNAVFETSEKMFLKKFVECHGEEAPELLKLYKDKLNLSD